LLITAGYSLPEAIRCASSNGARLLGIEDFGVISEGMAATFLVAEGDPSKLPDSLGSPDFIYCKGNIVNFKNEI
jgi:imidazolonepropionase-like amidohydrolase